MAAPGSPGRGPASGDGFVALPRADDISLDGWSTLAGVPLDLDRLLVRAASLAAKITAGRGFSADMATATPEVCAVLRAAVVRAVRNFELPINPSNPPFSSTPGGFPDWTEQELRILRGQP